MAGILNNKSRIFDTVLTTEGRRQLAAGTFKIEFASFSDSATFYQGDVASGSADAGARIFFEAATNLRDQITFETDDSGVLVPFTKAGSFQVVGNKIIANKLTVTSSARFASTVSDLLSSSLDNYKNLYSLGTDDIFLETGDFRVSRENVTFNLTSKRPLNPTKDVTETSINNVESFYADKRLSHIPNFKYLPPVNKGTSNPIGEFPCRGQKPILSFKQLRKQLLGREKVEITFPSTSSENNLVSQMFEISNGRFTKLDIIDFGEFVNDEEQSTKHVYFVGKVFEDDAGFGTFVNMFVLVFDRG